MDHLPNHVDDTPQNHGSQFGQSDHVAGQHAQLSQRELIQAAFAHVADAIFVSDLDGRIIEVNLAATELLGYSRAELIKMCPWDFVANESAQNIRDLINSVIPGEPAVAQRTYRRKSGQTIFVELRLSRCDLGGRGMVIAVTRDITERVKLEDRLRRSERSLAEGQRLTKTGSWILDYKTGLTDWSVETCRIFGFPDPPPSPTYCEFRARVRPEDREAVDRGLQESFETGEPRPLKYLFILPDGTRKHIETISLPVKNDAGALMLMGTVMDVTERTLAAEALRQSEHLARGQLASLTTALDSLSQESDPDMLPVHILTTMVSQLDAHSATIWERDHDRIELFGVVHQGRLISSLEAGSNVVSIDLLGQAPPLWAEGLAAGDHMVIEGLDADPSRLVLADGRKVDWHEADVPYPFSALNKELALQGIRDLLIVPMVLAGDLAGYISVRFMGKRRFKPEEIELAQALAHQAMLALQLMRLSRNSRETAVAAERIRMARDIHDTLAQSFTGMIMLLEAAKGAYIRNDLPEVSLYIEQAGDQARAGLREARRSVMALRPHSLQTQSLRMALDNLLTSITYHSKLQVNLEESGEVSQLSPEQEDVLLRIAQESLTNTIRYANAKNVRLCLRHSDQSIQLQIIDDGCGFDTQAKQAGFGLIGMRERVEQLGGRFVLISRVGHGTEIHVALPTTKIRNQKGAEHA